MEYKDFNSMRYVGWQSDCQYSNLYSKKVIKYIQNQVTDLLSKMYPNSAKQLVTEQLVYNTMSSIYDTNRSNVGDIYSRYIVPTIELRCDEATIVHRTINTIVKCISDEKDMIDANKKLSKWTTVYGDFNKYGLRAHSQIKLSEKHPQHMMFNMNY